MSFVNEQRFSAEEDAVEVHAFKISEKQKASETGGEIVWRGANILMTAFFVMASGVQFNDPDPFLWVPLYGTAAILTVSIVVRPKFSDHKIWKGIYWIHTTFCVGMFFYVLIDLVIVATNPQSDGSLNPLTYEEGREMAGIMITVLWLFTCKQSPKIRCTFPLWCPFSKPRQSSANYFVDAGEEVGQTMLLKPATPV